MEEERKKLAEVLDTITDVDFAVWYLLRNIQDDLERELDEYNPEIRKDKAKQLERTYKSKMLTSVKDVNDYLGYRLWL